VIQWGLEVATLIALKSDLGERLFWLSCSITGINLYFIAFEPGSG
jgi:hypothetical protein